MAAADPPEPPLSGEPGPGPHAAPREGVAGVIDWLFRNRETGEITIAQWPNVSFGIFLAATVARRLLDPDGGAETALVLVATLALVWWAFDELVRGVNPWRRILGLVVLLGTLAGELISA